MEVLNTTVSFKDYSITFDNCRIKRGVWVEPDPFLSEDITLTCCVFESNAIVGSDLKYVKVKEDGSINVRCLQGPRFKINGIDIQTNGFSIDPYASKVIFYNSGIIKITAEHYGIRGVESKINIKNKKLILINAKENAIDSRKSDVWIVNKYSNLEFVNDFKTAITSENSMTEVRASANLKFCGYQSDGLIFKDGGFSLLAYTDTTFFLSTKGFTFEGPGRFETNPKSIFIGTDEKITLDSRYDLLCNSVIAKLPTVEITEGAYALALKPDGRLAKVSDHYVE